MAAKQPTESESTTTATFPLNYDCMFEVFQRLDFNECMNLSEAYGELQPIADRIYKRKFNKLTFDFEQSIDRTLYHAGPTAKSLTLILSSLLGYTESDLVKIGETCKKLRCLTLKGFNSIKVVMHPFVNTTTSNPFAHITSEHLEELRLKMCYIKNNENFFVPYKNLKYLNFDRCQNIEAVAIKKCFENNQKLKSFNCDSQFIFSPQLLQLVPNLERLCLRYNSRYMNLSSLSKLQSLRHLTLICWDDNVNNVLAILAKANILEELVLIDVALDENTFELIKQLTELHLLTVTSHDCSFPAYQQLPKDLKALKLGGFHIEDGDILSAVKPLKHLTDMHLHNCDLATIDFYITDFDSLAEFILDELEHIKRQLNVAVTSTYDQSLEEIWSVDRLRVTNYVENGNAFKISYRGSDD